MGYVDLRRRREESARDGGTSKSSWRAVRDDPYLSLATGLGAALTALVVWWLLLPDFSGLLLVPCTVLFCRGAWLLLRRGPGRQRTAAFGGEKWLLAAMADAGGTISAVHVALGTSLTVDGAEEILSRLADRGHLFVESHDGALFYRMPRERGASGSR